MDDGTKPSLKRRRLHALYILNDVLYHQIIRQGINTFASSIEANLPDLVASAASFDKCPKHLKKIGDLILLWESQGYFAEPVITKLRDALVSKVPSGPAAETTPGSLKLAKDAPWVLPSLHGDPSTPWYDLPASTWLPHITPNSTKPMNPNFIKPIQLKSGPADAALIDAVKKLLADADRIFSKEKPSKNDAHVDMNELGERIILDEITGEVIGGDTYYGWSRDFCEKMKDRRRKGKAPPASRGRSDSRSDRSRSSSRSSSGAPAFKRRRRDSYSRSPSRERRRRSPSFSRSRSPRRSRSYSRSPSGGRRHSPPRNTAVPPPPFPPHPLPPHLIPPRPAGYEGPWPPPPPPPPHMGGAPNWFPGMMPLPNMMGGTWPAGQPPHPHPPPPPRHNNGGYDGNHRGGHGGYRGQGYRGRDRGGHRGW